MTRCRQHSHWWLIRFGRRLIDLGWRRIRRRHEDRWIRRIEWWSIVTARGRFGIEISPWALSSGRLDGSRRALDLGGGRGSIVALAPHLLGLARDVLVERVGIVLGLFRLHEQLAPKQVFRVPTLVGFSRSKKLDLFKDLT